MGKGVVRRGLLVAAVVTTLGAGLAVASPAAAADGPPTLAGAWAPLNRCPVDAPAMLAADGQNVSASCLSSGSPNGSITLGATTIATGESNLQLGVLNQSNTFSVASPSGGAILAAPVNIPGGLLGLMCPSDIPVVSAICHSIVDSDLNRVTATVRAAGAPSEFDLAAGLSVGRPILRLPVRIQLANPLLGPNCYIGSEADPIVLHPANLSAPSGAVVRFAADGTESSTGDMAYVVTSGASQGDSTFAVPGANGCGLAGLLDFAVNLKQGLPSPAGSNSIVLDDATTYFGGFFAPASWTPTQGQQLADRWHAAVTG